MSYSMQTWNSGQAGGTPISATALTHIEQGIFNADTYTCTSTTKPTTGLFDGMRIYCTDTKAFGFYDATSSQFHMFDTIPQTYTPQWWCNGASSGGQTPGTGGSLLGYYMRRGRWCEIKVQMTVGSSGFNGGGGNWSFTAPFAAVNTSGYEQELLVKSWNNAGVMMGAAFIPGGSTEIRPYLPSNSSTSSMNQAANANTSGATGTGVPAVSGNYSWTGQGQNILITGNYEVVATAN